MKKLVIAGLIMIFWMANTAEAKTPKQIYQKADYVVKLTIQSSSTSYISSWGSGFIIKLEKYGFCVLTAEHNLKLWEISSPIITAYFKDGTPPQKLKFLYVSKNYDAVILKFSDPKFKPKSVAKIGKSSSVKPGSKVMTIGSGIMGDFYCSAKGFVYLKPGPINADLKAYFKKEGWKWFKKWPTSILTSVTVFQGNSGGPLLNEKGKVIGMMVAFFIIDYTPISIALPIDDLLLPLPKKK